jgi:hypothetical protein
MPMNVAISDLPVRRLASAILCAAALTPAAGAGQGGFDGFLRRLASAAPELRPPAVEQYLNLAGPTPLVDDGTAVFLAEGDRGLPPKIVASLPDEGTISAGEIAPGTMTRIAGTDWYYLKVRLAPATLVRYLLAYGNREEPDPRNPHVVTLAGRTMSEFRMPGGRLFPRPAPARSDQSTWTHASSTND